MDDSDRRSINSVVVGFELVRALVASKQPMTLKDLAAAAGMSAGRAHAYMTSFRTVGLVKQEIDGGPYELGPYAIALGMAALSRLDVRAVAQESMQRFRDITGHGVHLAVWSGLGPVIVSKVDGLAASPVSIRIGFAVPLEVSASGKVFSAFHTEAQAHLTVAGKADALQAECAQTRATGLASSDGRLNAGYAALSAPIFDHNGQLAAAMTALGPLGTFDHSLDGETAAALRKCAAAASEAMGYRANQ